MSCCREEGGVEPAKGYSVMAVDTATGELRWKSRWKRGYALVGFYGYGVNGGRLYDTSAAYLVDDEVVVWREHVAGDAPPESPLTNWRRLAAADGTVNETDDTAGLPEMGNAALVRWCGNEYWIDTLLAGVCVERLSDDRRDLAWTVDVAPLLVDPTAPGTLVPEGPLSGEYEIDGERVLAWVDPYTKQRKDAFPSGHELDPPQRAALWEHGELVWSRLLEWGNWNPMVGTDLQDQLDAHFASDVTNNCGDILLPAGGPIVRYFYGIDTIRLSGEQMVSLWYALVDVHFEAGGSAPVRVDFLCAHDVETGDITAVKLMPQPPGSGAPALWSTHSFPTGESHYWLRDLSLLRCDEGGIYAAYRYDMVTYDCEGVEDPTVSFTRSYYCRVTEDLELETIAESACPWYRHNRRILFDGATSGYVVGHGLIERFSGGNVLWGRSGDTGHPKYHTSAAIHAGGDLIVTGPRRLAAATGSAVWSNVRTNGGRTSITIDGDTAYMTCGFVGHPAPDSPPDALPALDFDTCQFETADPGDDYYGGGNGACFLDTFTDTIYTPLQQHTADSGHRWTGPLAPAAADAGIYDDELAVYTDGWLLQFARLVTPMCSPSRSSARSGASCSRRGSCFARCRRYCRTTAIRCGRRRSRCISTTKRASRSDRASPCTTVCRCRRSTRRMARGSSSRHRWPSRTCRGRNCRERR